MASAIRVMAEVDEEAACGGGGGAAMDADEKLKVPVKLPLMTLTKPLFVAIVVDVVSNTTRNSAVSFAVTLMFSRVMSVVP